MDEATLLHWVVYVGGPALLAYVYTLHSRQHHTEIENASMKTKLGALTKSHDQLHTLVTERNYHFEGKLERLSDKVETKVDK